MPDCKTCKAERKQAADVPYIVHESDMARLERTIKRLWILLLVVVVLLVGSNIAWIAYENSFVDEVEESVESYADDGGDAYGTIVSGNRSAVNYGTGESN